MGTPLTKHFISEAKNLIETGKIAGFMELADSLEWGRSSMSSVKAGRRDVPHHIYKRFTEMYNIAPYSETTRHTGDPIVDKYIASLEDRVEAQKRQLNLVTKELGRVAVQNLALLHTVLAAVTELIKKGSGEKIETVENRLNKVTTSFLKEYQRRGSLIDLDI